MTRPKHSTGTYVPAPARGDCPSGKVQYATRKQARRASKKMPGEALGTYTCPQCGWFHVGHVPQRVRAGEVDKQAWLKSKQKVSRRPEARRQRRAERAAALATPSDVARIVNRKKESA